MALLRLTAPFYKEVDFHLTGPPSGGLNPADDWAVHLIVLKGKKVAVAVHANSFLTFLLPLSYIKDIGKIPAIIGSTLARYLLERNLSQYKPLIDKLFFSNEFYYLKMNNTFFTERLTEIKNIIRKQTEKVSFANINWDKLHIKLHSSEMKMHTHSVIFQKPSDKFKEVLLGGK